MKLLVVEDDEAIAAALRRGLTAEGYTVEVSHDGDDALWRATEHGYDLILLDLLLPRRNGFRVCADLRAAGNWTPILMLTAKDGELDQAEGLDTGADDYLVKPFSFPVLTARIRALLRRSAHRSPAPLDIGHLRLDPGARRVWSAGREVAVTARELDVLTYLARRPGQVVSKTELLSGVWPDDFAGDPNIVEAYVARLRRKLDRPDHHPAITTIRGAGYRLEPA